MDDLYTIEKSGDSISLILKGSLNSIAANYLIENVLDMIKDTKNLYLDIEEVDYVCSAGLRFILMLQNAMDDEDGEMTVSSCNDIVKTTFDDTGFSNFLNWKI